MPAPSTLKISEIFWSAQGEGLRSGFPSIFVRFAGCSLCCEYCDTRESWLDGEETEVDAVRERVHELQRSYPQSQVVLTGGEPLEQDITPLVTLLHEDGFYLAVETNGLHFRDLPIDWWTVSPKEAAAFRIEQKLTFKMSEIKLVVTPGLTLDDVRRVRRLTALRPIFLQPEWHDPLKYRRAHEFYLLCQQAAIPEVRLGMQSHKIYEIR